MEIKLFMGVALLDFPNGIRPNVSTDLKTSLSQCNSMGKSLFLAACHHVTDAEVIIPRFGRYVKFASKHSTVPAGLIVTQTI